ncbi:MAG TPA: nucleotidyltransferase domain-containing protein [Anaerovoracaceae bacterium]|nr:nucleotidyltransferase domain-containing protein [Anaerovoracaceae bacterium]
METTYHKKIHEYSRAIVDEIIRENELDITIIDIKFYGSMIHGKASTASDIDVAVIYSGNLSEDAFFNIIKENVYEFDETLIDFNPLNIDKTDINNFFKKDKLYNMSLF